MNHALWLLRSRLGTTGARQPDGLIDVIDFSSSLINGEFLNTNICYGKGSGGGTNTVTNNSAPPADVTANYDQIMQQAFGVAGQPLQQYQGQTVAPLNSTENSAFGTINGAQGMAQPYIDNAQGLINQGTQPLWNGVQQFSPSNLQQYMSPYTGQVLNSAVAQQQNTDAQQQAALQGNAISSGAWGGDRAGVASAVLSGQQDLANNATNAGILNQGYTQGLGEFNTQQQAQLGANEANSYLAQQGAFGMANLGNEAFNTTLSGANAQLAAGQQQQQQTQSELNVPYEQFLQQQAYPFQTTSYLANLATGVGSGMGGTSSTTSPGASTTSQIAGLGLGGLGIIGGTGGFGSTGWLASAFANRGGAIKGYAPGGSVTPGQVEDQTGIPDVSVSYVPSGAGITRGSGLPQPPGAHSATGASSASSMPSASDIGNITKLLNSFQGPSTTSPNNSNIGGFGNVFGSGSGIDASTGNSLASQNSIDSSFLSSGDVGSSGVDYTSSLGSDASSLFQRGGTAKAFGTRQRKYAIGGEVLPDIISGVGDVVGAFFGDPGAGDQGVGILSNADGGATKGAGVEAQLFGMATGKSDSQTEDNATGSPGMGLNAMFNPGESNSTGDFTSGIGQETGNGAGIAASFFKRGGMARGYDDGGQVGGMTPMSSQLAPQQAPSTAGNLNNMTPEQLQQYVMRLPMGSPQQQRVQAVLQQKRMLPNVGTPAQGGLGSQQPMQQPMMARGGMARGYDNGGATDDLPPPPTPDQIASLTATTDGPPSSTPVPGAMGTNAAPQQSTLANSEPAPVSSRAPAQANPWLALANAGFAMAAGNSPMLCRILAREPKPVLRSMENNREKLILSTRARISWLRRRRRIKTRSRSSSRNAILRNNKQTRLVLTRRVN